MGAPNTGAGGRGFVEAVAQREKDRQAEQQVPVTGPEQEPEQRRRSKRTGINRPLNTLVGGVLRDRNPGPVPLLGTGIPLLGR